VCVHGSRLHLLPYEASSARWGDYFARHMSLVWLNLLGSHDGLLGRQPVGHTCL
jgi:hypothetical protein